MELSIAERIEQLKSGKMTKLQRRILEYLEATDYNQIIYLSITELAEQVHVAEATILRFCRSLGFRGYQEFKLTLAQERLGAAESRDMQGLEYTKSIVEDYHSALENCCRSLDVDRLSRVFDLVLHARSISCFGIGDSYIPALALHNRLMRMGLLSQCERDPHLQNVLVSTLGEGDILIIFSVSGSTKDMIETASLARSCGVKMIVVTCHDKSPLARFADLLLCAEPVEASTEPGAISSKIIQLFMVDVICAGIRLQDKARFDAVISRSNASTVNKLI